MTDIENDINQYEDNDEETPSKLDALWLGLTVGIVAPVITFLMFYTSSFTGVSFDYFIHYSIRIGVLINILTVCLVPNFVLFALFIWRNHYRLGKGMVIASASLTVMIILVRIGLVLYFKQ